VAERRSALPIRRMRIGSGPGLRSEFGGSTLRSIVAARS
jgi:hypothetical protein